MRRTRKSAAPAQVGHRPPVRRLPALLVALSLVATAAAPLVAQAGGGGHKSHKGSTRFTLDEAVSRVRGETRGRILSADTERVDGHDEHRVRVLTDQGRVRGYRLDAGDGSFRSRGRSGAPARERRDHRDNRDNRDNRDHRDNRDRRDRRNR